MKCSTRRSSNTFRRASPGCCSPSCVHRYAEGALPLLPGLWQIIFSLGVFASCRSLPPGMFAVGMWYLAAGLVSLALANAAPLSPLAMAIPFSIGQFLMAFVLYRATGGDDGED